MCHEYVSLIADKIPKQTKYYDHHTCDFTLALVYDVSLSTQIIIEFDSEQNRWSSPKTIGDIYRKYHRTDITYDKSQIKKIYQLVDGFKHGWYTEYFDYVNNLKSTEGWYNNGNREGIHTTFAKDQDLIIDPVTRDRTVETTVYKSHTMTHYNDEKNGLFMRYDRNGNILQRTNYINNHVHGIEYLYDPVRYRLWNHGKLCSKDMVHELHIDPANLSDTDRFTISMLGI